jgi:hypothetical protein
MKLDEQQCTRTSVYVLYTFHVQQKQGILNENFSGC